MREIIFYCASRIPAVFWLKALVVGDCPYTLASGRKYYIVLVRFRHEQHFCERAVGSSAALTHRTHQFHDIYNYCCCCFAHDHSQQQTRSPMASVDERRRSEDKRSSTWLAALGTSHCNGIYLACCLSCLKMSLLNAVALVHPSSVCRQSTC